MKKPSFIHPSLKDVVVEPIHVRVDRPLVIRRGLLEAAVYSTKMLTSYVELKEVRQKKAKLFEKFKLMDLDLKTLIKDFSSSLPKIVLPKEETAVVPVQIKEQKRDIVPQKTSNPEIDQLKRELEEIEHKLKGL